MTFSNGDEVYALNGAHHIILDIYFSTITHLGNALFYLPLLAIFIFIRFDYAIMFLITGTSHGLIVGIFKHVLFPMAPRPAKVLAVEQLYFVPGVDVHKIMSFPSGHTATAFAFLVLLSLLFRSRLITVVLSALAISVGLSRIYLLQHFGLDAAVGALIGTATSLITYSTFQVAKKPTWMLSKVRINRVQLLRNLIGVRQLFNLPIARFRFSQKDRAL